MKTLPICLKCNKHLKIDYNLSALGYCPSCTGDWVKDFMKLHKPRRRHK